MRFLVLFSILFSLNIHAQIETDTLKVGYTNAPPFLVQAEDDLYGLNHWLWDRLASDLGIEYELIQMSFRPMLDSLNAGAIDVSINPLTITAKRNETMDFTSSYYASNSTIVIKEASSLQKLIGFVKGFLNVNFLRGMLFLIMIILFFGILGWYFERKKNPDHFRKGFKGLWDGLWWSAVTLTTVGYGDKAPKSGQGKIVALVLMFVGLLFISSLTASIASSMTVNQMSMNTDNISAFKDRKVGSISNSSSIGFLKTHFFNDIEEFNSVNEGLTALEEGELDAFMYDEPILRYRIAQNDKFQELRILPLKYDIQFYAFGLSEELPSETKNRISQRILEITETNEWEILLKEYDLSEFQ